jgi:hypothetical protein
LAWLGLSDGRLIAVVSVLQALGEMNIPVFVASGDNGAKDGQLTDSVLYPASSPNAFGCGEAPRKTSNETPAACQAALTALALLGGDAELRVSMQAAPPSMVSSRLLGLGPAAAFQSYSQGRAIR